MANLKFHPQVSSEIKSSYNWYQKQAEGLGEDFLNELKSAYQAIVEFPKAWPPFKKGFRRFILSKFPFSVIYKENENNVFVVAVMHNSRRPGYWLKRL